MVTRLHLFFLVLGFLVAGCLGAKIGYRAYGLDADSYSGWLRAPKPKDDIPLSVCTPDSFEKGKCVVLLTAEYEKLATELLQLRSDLKSCQKQCQQRSE